MRFTKALPFCLVALVAAANVSPASTRTPATVVCPAAGARKAAIRIDGKADEPSWRDAARVGPMLHLVTAKPPANDVTGIRLVHDASTLYLFVDCAGGRGGAPPPRRPRDHFTVTRTDHLEVFLDPAPDTPDLYRLAVDRGGSVSDSRDGPKADGAAWNGAWRVAVKETGGGWAAEFALPFKAFGVERVRPGDLWRLKVGRGGGRDGWIMWPANPTKRFRSPLADAALYFDRENLLINGDFETGRIVKGAPKPWSASSTSPEVKNAPQGTVSVVPGGAPPGRRALRFTKLDTALWWPQVWSPYFPTRGGGTHEFSILAKGDIQWVNLRASSPWKGGKGKVRLRFRPPREFGRLGFRFVTPAKSEKTAVGITAPAHMAGAAVFDNAVLRRVFPADDAARAMKRPASDYSPEPNPVHGLEALHERAGLKPWDLYWRDGKLLSCRVMFKDAKYGTDLWLVDFSPAIEYSVTASIWPGWNCDGSILYIPGRRGTDHGSRSGWLANAQFSRLVHKPSDGMPLWDGEDPNVYYVHDRHSGEVRKVNVRTRKRRLLASWKPRPRERSYGLTKDNRSVFVVDHDMGLWVPYRPGAKPLPYVAYYGNGQLNDREILRRTRGIDAKKGGKDLLRILIGTRVYTDTGRTERVIVPICGRTEYLRAFAEGRIAFPKGAAPPATKDLDELFKLYHLYPSCSHGHSSRSPDGEYVCWDHGPQSWRARDGRDQQFINLKPDAGGVYHLCWLRHPRYYVSGVPGPFGKDLSRSKLDGVQLQVFADGTWQPVCDIKPRRAAFYYRGDFATLSPDATKAHYASAMLDTHKQYVSVLARPQAPRRLRRRADGDAVALSWTPPRLRKEVRGYRVYRSDRSGDGYVALTRDPVRATTWRDATVKPGKAHFYVVTALEHCGLESGYSGEAAPPNAAGPLVVYAEAEDAFLGLGTGERPGVAQGRDRKAASNWFYVYRHPRAKRGEAALRVAVPASTDYFIWVRTRRGDRKAATWDVRVDGKKVGAAPCPRSEWAWVRVGKSRTRLDAGERLVTLSTRDKTAQADLVCLATAADFTPKGPRPEDSTPPEAVRGVRVAQPRPRCVALKWQVSPAPDFDHFNVYASRRPLTKAGPHALVASPTYGEFIDWGLRPGTLYHYAVTAVDRRGNESPLGRVLQVTTPARPYPEQRYELRFDHAQLAGRFERGKAAGTHAAEYVLIPPKTPRKTAARQAASWSVDVKRSGTYYFWLRYLGKGSTARHAGVRQAEVAAVDGRTVAQLRSYSCDLSVPDDLVRPEFWTWAPAFGKAGLLPVKLKAGRRKIAVRDLSPSIRYDVLLITDEPSFKPPDGRIRQN